jgi:tetratricopeptide (TPR) repeat protein
MTRAVPAIPAFATAVLLTLTFATGVAAQENGSDRAAAATTVSPVSKLLRALGLESPPGARGDRAYRKGDYEEALRQYGKAAEETAPASPAQPLLNKNIGNALYRQKRHADAIDYYERALKGSGRDSGFAARAHHNLGNAYYRKAEAAQAKDAANMQEAIADLREAVAHYKKALQMDRGNRNTKQNLEMANAHLQQLMARQEQQQQQQQQQGKPPGPPEPSPQAKEALARALQLAQQRRYDEAMQVLDGILRTDRTAASFAGHRQRLDDVAKILRGETPSSPAPQDPRAIPGKSAWKPGPPGLSPGLPPPSGGRRAP